MNERGRAGIIVPEGIIFQSQNAYKQLRRLLVEESLVAVISLPSGVFQPYSGVKTSILILDKVLAQKADGIAFFKVENDGYDLGAQRRPLGKDDLPAVAAEISEYLYRLHAGETMDDFEPQTGLLVSKNRAAEDGDYNLSGERYRESIPTSARWPMVKLEDCCSAILSGGTPSTAVEDYWEGDIPWITSADIISIKTALPRKYISDRAVQESTTNLIKKGNLIVVTRVGLGKIFQNDFDVCISQDSQGLIIQEGIEVRYLAWVLRDKVQEFKRTSQGSTIQGVTKKQLSEIEIPLPPLEVQRELVAEMEGYQRVIDGARAVVDNWRPRIVVDPEWPLVELGEVCSLISGQHINTEDYNTVGDGIGYLTGPADFGDEITTFSKWTIKPKVMAYKGDILITVKGSGLGKVVLLEAEEAAISRQLMAIRVADAVPQYVYSQLSGMYDHIQSVGGGAAIPGITRDDVLKLILPLPSLKEQEEIVSVLNREREVVGSNRELIGLFEGKIQDSMARLWKS